MITEEMRRQGTTPTLAAAMQVRPAPAASGARAARARRHAPCLRPTPAAPPLTFHLTPPPQTPSPLPHPPHPHPHPHLHPHIHPHRPQDLFSEYDIDASGSISFEELASGLTNQGYVVSPSEVTRQTRAHPTPGPRAAWAQRNVPHLAGSGTSPHPHPARPPPPQHPAPQVRQLMKRLDTDNTGQVEGDEFVAALIDWCAPAGRGGAAC
jgi:hypothetical protein